MSTRRFLIIFEIGENDNFGIFTEENSLLFIFFYVFLIYPSNIQ